MLLKQSLAFLLQLEVCHEKSADSYLLVVTFHFKFLDIAFLIGSLYFINSHK